MSDRWLRIGPRGRLGQTRASYRLGCSQTGPVGAASVPFQLEPPRCEREKAVSNTSGEVSRFHHGRVCRPGQSSQRAWSPEAACRPAALGIAKHGRQDGVRSPARATRSSAETLPRRAATDAVKALHSGFYSGSPAPNYKIHSIGCFLHHIQDFLNRLCMIVKFHHGGNICIYFHRDQQGSVPVLHQITLH